MGWPTFCTYYLLVTLTLTSCQKSALFDSNYKCSPEGAEIQRANVYFHCAEGSLKAAGCIGYENERVPINKTYKAFGKHEMMCEQLSDYFAQLVPLTCWRNETEYQPGETYIEGRFWYTCLQTSNGPLDVLSGCVGENNTLIHPGSIFKLNNFFFTCARLGSNGLNMMPTACLYNGMQTLLDQDVNDAHFVYTCRRHNNAIYLSPSGCVWNEKKLAPGWQYVKDGFLFQCTVQGSKVSHTMVGCLGDNNVTYQLNEKWTTGRAPFRYVVQCSRRGKHGLMKRLLQCAYDHMDGRALLNPACMSKVGKVLVQCYSPDNNTIAYKINSLNEPYVEKKALAAGFRYCKPNES